MPTLHELFATSIDERALRYAVDDPGPRAETLGRIRRARRRNTVATGTTSAIAVTSGFFVAAQGDNGLASPAGGPADAAGEVVIDLANLSPFPTLSGIGPDAVCGASIDDIGGAASADGFAIDTSSLQESVLGAEGGYTQVRTAVTYTGEPRQPAFVDTGYAVIVTDGTVVALVDPSPNPRFERLDSGSEWVEYVTLKGGADTSIRSCNGETLRPGEYEVYVIAQAQISEELLARQLLAEQGVVLAPGGKHEWAPGSEACEQEARFPTTGARVLQCQPELAPDVLIDWDRSTATVPYSPSLYSGDLSVLLVSTPLPLTITGATGISAPEPETDEAGDAVTGDVEYIECELRRQWEEEMALQGYTLGDGTRRIEGGLIWCEGVSTVQANPDGTGVSIFTVP
jgi:hypothetical protein